MKLSVAGTGYVGLVSGVCFAERGHEVVCVDIDADKVAKINQGVAPIHEIGLEELLQNNIGRRLTASVDLHQSVLNSDATLIAVGTPFDGDEIDLTFIKQVAAEIGAAIKEKPDYHLVIVKSTVVPGTTEDVVLPILEAASGKRAGEDFGLGMNPEFLKEGEAVLDFMNPDRIVYGGIDERSCAMLAELYSVFSDVDQLETDCRTAEMIKYAANSLLATMISFANEIGNLCSATPGVDVKEVMQGVHLDKRLSPILSTGERVTPAITTYIEAGCGFGGSCFPKDVKALIAYGEKAGVDMQILNAVTNTNRNQPRQMLNKLSKHYSDLCGLKVAILGFAFKQGTSDVRESPALPIARWLTEAGARISGFDPVAQDNAAREPGMNHVAFKQTLADAIDDADVIMIVTRWEEFEALPEMIKDRTNPPLVIDGRRILAPSSVPRYEGIGVSK